MTSHHARLGGGGDLLGALDGMTADIEGETRKLAQIEPHAIAYACTSGSFYDGPGSDIELCKRIAAISAARATTATTAGIWELRERGARRIVFCSPYEQSVHERGGETFAAAGFQVILGGYLGLTTNAEIGAVSAEEVGDLVQRSWVADADAVFLSCTGLRTADVLEPLSAALRRPVVSSNAALARHLVALADAAVPAEASP